MSIGAALHAARQEAGLSVDDVAMSTRIRATLIRAIEADDFAGCGGTTYARGHIRSIAAAVGIDAAPLVTEFNQSQGPAVVLPVHQILDRTEIVQRNRTAPNWTAAMLVTAVLLAAVAFVGLVTGENDGVPDTATKTSSAPVVPAAGPTEPPAPPAGLPSDSAPVPVPPAVIDPAPGATPPSTDPSQPPATSLPAASSAPAPSSTPAPSAAAPPSDPVVAFSGVTVRVSATVARCWVQVSDLSRAKKVLYTGVLERGTGRDFTATGKLSITFGDAGAVALTVNGRDLGAPGARGAVVTVPFVPGDPGAA